MRSLRHIFASLCLSMALLPAASAYAATAAELQSLQDGGYRITSQLFMYTILERAGERRKDVARLISVIEPRVAALKDKDVQSAWQALRTSATADPYVNNEVAQQALYAVEDNATRFAQALERLMPQDADPKKQAVNDLISRMHVMMTIYLRNSADPIGGANYAGINRELDLEKLPGEFSAKLTALEKNQPAMAPVIAKIRPKWAFLSPRLSDYNQKSVPFLVDIYGRQIIDQLIASAPN